MKYEFKDNLAQSICKVDAQRAGTEIEKIRISNGGIVSTQRVLDVAKKPNNPLHNAFEWDDAKAANKYRVQQARRLISSIVIIEKENGKEKILPAFVTVKIEDEARSYRDIKTIKADESLHRSIEKQAIKDLKNWINRYHSFTELSPVIEPIRLLIKNIYDPIDEADEILTQRDTVEFEKDHEQSQFLGVQTK